MRKFIFSGMIAFLMLSSAYADTAIIVGVNEYSKLPSGANLKGCVPDAQQMAATLKKYGFEVVLVINSQATREGILSAVKNSGNKPGERFVFYFAGHETNVGGASAVILPSDAALDSSDFDLRAEDLKNAVMAVPASNRTIILDSCFSGGMVRTKSARIGLKTRYFARPTSSTRPASVNRLQKRGDGTKDLVMPSKAGAPCYIVATAPNEKAAEDVFDGVPHGVFTKFLTERLSGSAEKWDAVMTDVKGKAADYLDDTQHPEMSPQFRDEQVFAPSEAPKPSPKPEPQPLPEPKPQPPLPSSLWNLYNVERPDPKSVQILLLPDMATNKIGDRLTLTAQVGREGYLVVIERGTSGTVNLLFPEKAQVDAAKTSGGRITLGIFRPNQEGDERVKGILFEKREDAEALLKAFGQGTKTRAVPMKDLRAVPLQKSKDLVRVNEAPRPDGFGFLTSDIQFEIVK